MTNKQKQEPHWASAEEIKAFHATEYIDFLQRVNPVNQKDLGVDLQKCTLTRART